VKKNLQERNFEKRPARIATHGGSVAPGLVRFRKHHRPCGQPAVEGGFEFLRPLPAQVGHFKRINAMPSDLPLMSTGRAMYPVPPQRGQSFGSTDPPQLLMSFSSNRAGSTTDLILLRNTNSPSLLRTAGG
jgi:hypothetical protein